MISYEYHLNTVAIHNRHRNILHLQGYSNLIQHY